MSLRTRLLLTGGVLRYGGTACLLLLMLWHWAAIALAGAWLLWCRPVLRYVLLPAVFPTTKCPKCGYIIPLKQFWGCGEHYKDHRPRHVLAFHCSQGHEIKFFDCPRKDCQCTIQVQKGSRHKLAKATILGNAFHLSPQEQQLLVRRLWRWFFRRPVTTQGVRLPLGIDRRQKFSVWRRLLARLFRRDTQVPVEIPEAVYGRHMTIFGKSGMGKSKLILRLAQSMFEEGMGATFIDPAGDLSNEIIRMVPEHRRDDVLWIRVSDTNCPFRLNILETKDTVEEINLNEEVLSALRRMSQSWGEQIAHQIDMAIDTAKAVNGSLQDVHDLFANSAARNRIVSQLDDLELIEFWADYERSTERSKAPVKRKIRTIVKHKLLGPMLCSRESNFDADEIVRGRKIVVVDLSTGSTSENINVILGTFIVSKIMSAAFRQKFLKEGERTRHTLVIDEAKNFMHKGMNFERIFSEARKYKLSLILANQHVTQMNNEVRDAAFSNAGVLLSFNVDRDDAKLFAERMSNTTVGDFTSQNVGECIARIHHGTHFIRTVLPTEPIVDSTPYIRERMKAMSAVESAEPEQLPTKPSLPPEEDARFWVPVCQGIV